MRVFHRNTNLETVYVCYLSKYAEVTQKKMARNYSNIRVQCRPTTAFLRIKKKIKSILTLLGRVYLQVPHGSINWNT